MGIRVSAGNEHIEQLRARWAAGEATPEEIKVVRAYLEAQENTQLWLRGIFVSVEFWGLVTIAFVIYVVIDFLIPAFKEMMI